MPDTATNRLGLTNGQALSLILIGAVLWFVAVLILRSAAPYGALEGTTRGVTYALIIPGTLPFIWLTKILTRIQHNQIALGMAVATATALLIDGIVVAWFPAIYAVSVIDVKNCAAAILWGAGVALALGLILNREQAA